MDPRLREDDKVGVLTVDLAKLGVAHAGLPA